LAGVRLFNASGCTTGLSDLRYAPDELSSFAVGVLQAGAAAAIATQWFVDDLATFLLMLRFARLVLGDPALTPACALRDAAAWLRRATWAELEALAKQGMRKLRPIPPNERAARNAVRGVGTAEVEAGEGAPDGKAGSVVEVATTRDLRFSAAVGFEALGRKVPAGHRRARPFEHPIYWACAVVYGA
jgi:CHAT domain-containing protein